MLHRALGLYLLTRFEVINELEHMNFADNSTWFNRKLLKSMVNTLTCEGKYSLFRGLPSI